MTDEIYRSAFEQAKKDLAKAMTRRQHAEKEAVQAQAESIQLRRTVTALAAVCGENIEDSMGLTEAIRAVIAASSTESWYILKYFKMQVEQLGVSLDDLKNPDASVLSVLARLVASKELITKMVKAGTPPVDTRAWRKPLPAPVQAADLTDDDIPF